MGALLVSAWLATMAAALACVPAHAAPEEIQVYEDDIDRPGSDAGPWDTRYPAIGQRWRRAWTGVIPFFAFPDEVCRIVYTTNAIEALNSNAHRNVALDAAWRMIALSGKPSCFERPSDRRAGRTKQAREHRAGRPLDTHLD